MDPNKVELEGLSKKFEYQKLANELDKCDSIDEIRSVAKCYIKLYFKQQEVLALLMKRFE